MMRTLTYGERQIDYEVHENPQLKRNVRIHVHPNGMVEVETPIEKSLIDVEIAVHRKARWITNHLTHFENLKEHALPRLYISGETHFYLGKRYSLKVIKAEKHRSDVLLKNGCINVVLPCPDPSAVKRRLNAWYKTRAAMYFEKRLNDISSQIEWLKTKPVIKLTRMKKQWGSCSVKGDINLNPLLIKAPRECIDYVLTHEICHIQEHNHSKRFYSLLRREFPNWEKTKSKLDGMAEMLLVE